MSEDLKVINNFLGKVDSVLVKAERTICCTLIVVMSCVIFLQIICRTFRFPLVWSEELGRFMFIWLIYISVCVSTQRESHLCCDILPIFVHHPVGRNIIKIVANLLSMCFFIFVAYYGVEVLQKLILRPQRSAAMHINMVWAYLGPYLGAAMASIHYIVLIFHEIGEIIQYNRDKKEEIGE